MSNVFVVYGGWDHAVIDADSITVFKKVSTLRDVNKFAEEMKEEAGYDFVEIKIKEVKEF